MVFSCNTCVFSINWQAQTYIHSKYIIRKVIIFKIKETNIVIYYNRKFQRLFYDVVVPTVYEKGDVILIQGDGVNQKLIGIVKCVDDKEKTVCVYFLRQERDKTYVRERRGRDTLNTVHWKSILAVLRSYRKTKNQWTLFSN